MARATTASEAGVRTTTSAAATGAAVSLIVRPLTRTCACAAAAAPSRPRASRHTAPSHARTPAPDGRIIAPIMRDRDRQRPSGRSEVEARSVVPLVVDVAHDQRAIEDDRPSRKTHGIGEPARLDVLDRRAAPRSSRASSTRPDRAAGPTLSPRSRPSPARRSRTQPRGSRRSMWVAAPPPDGPRRRTCTAPSAERMSRLMRSGVSTTSNVARWCSPGNSRPPARWFTREPVSRRGM